MIGDGAGLQHATAGVAGSGDAARDAIAGAHAQEHVAAGVGVVERQVGGDLDPVAAVVAA